jgi:hypothetical protein
MHTFSTLLLLLFVVSAAGISTDPLPSNERGGYALRSLCPATIGGMQTYRLIGEIDEYAFEMCSDTMI